MRAEYDRRGAANRVPSSTGGYVTIQELSRLLTCTEDTIRRMMERGELTSYLAGSVIRFRRTEVEDLLRRRHRRFGF